MYVNRLNTEESVIPYEYHHFDFCSVDESNSPVENLGQVVFGERIRPSPYQIDFLENIQCKHVCTKTYKGSNLEDNKKLSLLKKGMSLNYQHHWIVDNMPVTWCYLLEDGRQYCSTGFPMGCLVRPSQVFIYFHIGCSRIIVINFHRSLSLLASMNELRCSNDIREYGQQRSFEPFSRFYNFGKYNR